MIFKYNNKFTRFARSNRRIQTEAEKLLWYSLRGNRFKGYKFRRQFPVLNYILDFYCSKVKLGIELDGSQHKRNQLYDNNRDRILQAAGIQVVRFLDTEIFKNTAGVLEVILQIIEKRPHPDPLLIGEGKKGTS